MYAAPERVENNAVDQRADVYALGLLLWTICGSRSVLWQQPQTLLLKQISKDPPRLDEVLGPKHEVPSALEQLIALAIRKEPERRIQSARELGRGLSLVERALTGERPCRALPIRGRLLVYDDPDSTEARALAANTLSDEATVELTEEQFNPALSMDDRRRRCPVYWIGVVTATLLVAVLAGGWWWFGTGTEATTDLSASVQETPATRWW